VGPSRGRFEKRKARAYHQADVQKSPTLTLIKKRIIVPSPGAGQRERKKRKERNGKKKQRGGGGGADVGIAPVEAMFVTSAESNKSEAKG